MTNETISEIESYRWVLFGRCEEASDMDDIMQNVLLNLLKKESKLDSLNEKEKKNYIIRSIKNAHIDFIRRRRVAGYGHLTVPIHEVNIPDGIQPDVYAKLELEGVLKKGKEYRFFPLLLLLAEGYSVREIAELTGGKINTILGRHRYTRIFLKNEKK